MIGIELYLLALTAVCFFLFIIGVPIVLIFGLWAIGFHIMVPGFPMANMSIAAYQELQSFPFAAIPLFIIVGDLISRTGIAKELVDFAHSIVGWLPGSSGNTSLVTSGIFSAITGSNAATTASVGKAMQPELVRKGYKESSAAATIASGGIVGSVLPPSILLIVYGVTFNVSIPDLFIAGIIPGLMMIAGLIVMNTYIAKKEGYDSPEGYTFSITDIAQSAWNAKLGLGTIVILLGGIFMGIFTPSEASAIAILYIISLAVVTGRLKQIGPVINSLFTSMRLTGALMPTVVFAVLVQQNLSYLGLEETVSAAIMGLGNDFLIAIAIIVILLITGSILSSVPNLVLTAPLLAGAATELGFSPIMWGIIFMMSDSIGFITPPYGINLFVISGITDIDYMKIAYQALPYLIASIAVWVLFIAFPEINFLI